MNNKTEAKDLEEARKRLDKIIKIEKLTNVPIDSTDYKNDNTQKHVK